MSRISALLSVIVIALILAPAPALASDGDDFGRGYEILVARSRFGPPLALTNGSRHEYLFRYGDRQADPQECFVDTNCGDGIFCNGAETCTNHSCGPGSLPACSDGNACTDDFCDTVADACAFAPLTDPGEVLNLNLEILAASTIARLTWNAQAAASEYNVYRSEAIDLENLACYQVTPMNMLDDVGEIPVSGLFEFLVTSFGCGGESTLGVPPSGVEREPAAVCP